jgi:hypothetical protein
MEENYAELDIQNKVINILVIDSENIEFLSKKNYVKYTSDNPASVGGDYFENFFYPPQPYPSWTRKNGKWIAPIENPNVGDEYLESKYIWNEIQQNWFPEPGYIPGTDPRIS